MKDRTNGAKPSVPWGKSSSFWCPTLEPLREFLHQLRKTQYFLNPRYFVLLRILFLWHICIWNCAVEGMYWNFLCVCTLSPWPYIDPCVPTHKRNVLCGVFRESKHHDNYFWLWTLGKKADVARLASFRQHKFGTGVAAKRTFEVNLKVSGPLTLGQPAAKCQEQLCSQNVRKGRERKAETICQNSVVTFSEKREQSVPTLSTWETPKVNCSSFFGTNSNSLRGRCRRVAAKCKNVIFFFFRQKWRDFFFSRTCANYRKKR